MKRVFIIAIWALIGLYQFAWSNNLQIDVAPILTGQDITNHFTFVQFDLSWDNSWHTDLNWDAAYIFVKYRIGNGDWMHATLHATTTDNSHTILSNNGIPATITPLSDGRGVFINRNSNTGSNNWQGVKLRWDYGLNGLTDTLSNVAIRVFAIEMVYVPQGAFYVGDKYYSYSAFYTYNNSSTAYFINSENAINVGATTGYMNYYSGGDHQGPIPNGFPKGYNAFYCMKYEITQRAYCDFLNTLGSTAAGVHFPNNFNSNRQFIKYNSIYGCDKNNNNILNESDDGQDIACNFLSWSDGAAYADWAGLRPMTELEFEKACRGTNDPVTGEFAWGTTNYVTTTGISNSGLNNEIATNPTANYVAGNQSNVQGPLRVGCFANSTSNRIQAGASFYGIMNLSGNLWEQVVGVGDPVGRAYTGIHGDGHLTSAGMADVSNWPVNIGTNVGGTMLKGGSWYYGTTVEPSVSGRTVITEGTSRYNDCGFRCVCTAP